MNPIQAKERGKEIEQAILDELNATREPFVHLAALVTNVSQATGTQTSGGIISKRVKKLEADGKLSEIGYATKKIGNMFVAYKVR